jgi:hypothetical protein
LGNNIADFVCLRYNILVNPKQLFLKTLKNARDALSKKEKYTVKQTSFARAKRGKRPLALILTAAMLFALFPALTPTVALAEESPAPRTIFANIEPGGFNSANTAIQTDKTIKLTGSSSLYNGSIYISAPANGKSGGAFLSRRIYSETGFSSLFQIRMGEVPNNNYGAADGWAFIVAKDANSVGGAGVSIGYSGIKDSYAFLYDTYYNPAYGTNNVALQHPEDKVPIVSRGVNGARLEAENDADSVLYAPASGNKYNLAKNYVIYGWVDYSSKEGTMKFYLNDMPEKPEAPISTIMANIESTLGNQYYIGFTSSSGNSYQQTLLQQFYVFNEYASDIDFNTAGDDIVIPDASGNPTAPDEIIEDYTPPTAPVVTQSENGMTDALMVFTVGGSEDMNGVRKYQYRIGDETAWRDYANANGGGYILDASLPVTAAIVPGGDVTVYARALDFGGNISSETAATLRYTIAPGPTLTSPANGSVNVFPANTLETILSFKSKIDAGRLGTVRVIASDGSEAQFAGGPVAANDTRWDASQSKLTLPFALGETGMGYGKNYTVTVSGFVNTSNISMGDKDTPATETFTFSTIGRETTPNAGIDFTNERLTGLLNGVVYAINGAEYTASGGVIPVQAAWLGTNIQIVKPGTATTVDSAAQTLAIPARRNAPAVAQTPGFITGTTTEMEYSSSLTGTYSACAAGQTYVADGVYYVRYKVGANEFKSATATIEVAEQTFTLNVDGVSFDIISYGDTQLGAKSIAVRSSGNTDATITSVASSSADFIITPGNSTVPKGGENTSYTVRPAENLGVGVHTATITFNYNGGRTATAQVSFSVREATPDIGIDFVNEQLTNLTQGAVYTVNGNSRTASTGKLNIENAYLGTEISIVKTNANTSLNSLVQTLSVPARPGAPISVSNTNEIYAGENDGALTGVMTDMEYRRAGDSWTSGTDSGDITNRAPGEYQVRSKAVANISFPSRATALTITASRVYKLNATVSVPESTSQNGYAGGVNGKNDTKYLLVTFEHATAANAEVPIAGLTASSSNGAGVWVAGAASAGIAGTVGDNGDSDDRTWRVNIYPTQNNETAAITFKDWTAANGNTYTVISTDPSPANLTVFKVVTEPTPTDATVDYANEYLTGLTYGAKYKINGAERTADGSGYIPLGEFIPKANEADRTLSIVKSGMAASVDSAAQTLTLPRRPATPEGDIGQPTSKSDPNDKGSITIKNPIPGATYEYGLLNTITGAVDISDWEDFPAGTPPVVSGRSPGTYYARVKAVATESFASDSRSFHIRAFESVDFGSVYVGYETVALPVRAELGETITDVAWVNDVTLSPAAFTLAGSGANWTVTPKANLEPKSDGSPYAARLVVTTAAISTFTLPVSLWVHPRAEIARVEESGTDTKRATNEITVTFERPIDLIYSDVAVDGAAVKTVGETDFVSGGSGARTSYKIAVTPLMSKKNGDFINVRVNIGSDHLLPAYHFQNSNGESGVTDSVSVSIPRMIASAEMITPIPGYSTGYVQFTLNSEYCPIDTDAFEEAMDGIELKVNGNPVKIGQIFRVDADMGYTFRLRVTPTESGNMTLALPGFGITEPFSVSGSVPAAGKKLTDNAFVLSENGSNYLTDPNDARQILQPVNASNGLTPVYEAPAFDLRVNREYGDWTVSEFYVDGEIYSNYTTAGGGPLNQIFDGDAHNSYYPDLTNYLKITLPAGWTSENGTHTIHAVLTRGDESVLLFAKTNVTGLAPMYTLTVTGGTGGGLYPAGTVVQIQSTAPTSAYEFLGWTQAASLGDAGYIAKLPADINGTIVMPAGDAALTAQYEAPPYRPPNNSPVGGGSTTVENPDDENKDDENKDGGGQGAVVPPFEDVRESDWFYGDVAYLYGKGLMLGVSDTLFAPNENLTRAMIVTMLYRYEQLFASAGIAVSGAAVFDDVDGGQWYSDAIAWAAENEIVLGVGGGKFEPNAHITREQFATILYRYYGRQADNGDANLSGYTDAAQISDWAIEAVKWAHKAGLIIGRTPTTLVPQGEATRAESAALLHRFIEKFGEE